MFCSIYGILSDRAAIGLLWQTGGCLKSYSEVFKEARGNVAAFKGVKTYSGMRSVNSQYKNSLPTMHYKFIGGTY